MYNYYSVVTSLHESLGERLGERLGEKLGENQQKLQTLNKEDIINE
jgi:hypothetical protein